MAGLASLGLCACAASGERRAPTPHQSTSGESWTIKQLTASTWTATAAGAAGPAGADGAARKADLLNAIEKASGCRVTDSDFAGQGRQLDAQVVCGSRLKD